MRKLTAALLAMTLSIAVIATPRPAHAIIAATGGTSLLTGGILLGLGLGLGLIGVAPAPLYCQALHRACGSDIISVGIIGTGLLVIVAIIVLDDKTGEEQFQSLNSAEATAFGLSEDEQTAYNSEIEEINVIAESTAADHAGGLTDEQITGRYADQVSPATASAVAKILQRTLE